MFHLTIFQTLQNEIIYIQRPIDKKKIVFYKDRLALPVDEDFQKLWRSVAVDAMDDAKIDEYLEKQGLFLFVLISHLIVGCVNCFSNK